MSVARRKVRDQGKGVDAVSAILLGGYPAKQCARITHNKYSPTAPPPAPTPPELQALFDEGRVFETAVVDEFVSRFAGSGDLLVLDEDADWEATKRLTLDALRAGVPIVVGGRLPDVNGRVGAPDVLIRHADGYLPVDIKNHRTLNPSANPESPRARSVVDVSALNTPDDRHTHRGYSNTAGHWRHDAMQLAHYTRMLQELGLHPVSDPALIGGIIGTSNLSALTGDELGIVWYDLAAPAESTFSATEPGHRKRRSPLERYDHEFAFRLAVAEAARDGGELVRPFRTNDCDSCEWFEYCADVVGPDDASFALAAGHLNVREWLYLYGGSERFTVDDLARTDAATVIDGFREQSVGTANPHKRLEDAIRRARMTLAGIDFQPHGATWPEVPCADIEVDFDIEWDTDGRIYQWGLRIREGQDDTTARYEPVVSFDVLDERAEEALADVFAARLNALKDAARQENKSIRVFHWHHVEVSLTRKFDAVAAALDGITCDLLAWFNANFFARQTASIKNVAPLFGFQWDVDDAGGRVSQLKIAQARGAGPEAEDARRWCLLYNESDVAAQAAIRDGLRATGRAILPQ